MPELKSPLRRFFGRFQGGKAGSDVRRVVAVSSHENTFKLLQALNSAAAIIQRSAHSEQQIFDAFSAQVSAMGLRGGLALLDSTRETAEIRAIAYPRPALRFLSWIEKVFNIQTIGYRVPITGVATYQSVIESGKCTFKEDSKETVEQLLPEFAKPYANRVTEAFGKKPVVYAPMISDEHPIGVMNISGNDISREDIPAIQAFANHIAIAITNQRLYEAAQREVAERRLTEKRLEQQYAELQTIYDISRGIQNLETPLEVAETIINVFEKKLGYEFSAILLIDETRKHLFPFAVSRLVRDSQLARNRDLKLEDFRIEIGRGITGWVAQHGESVRTGNAPEDPRFLPLLNGVLSELCVPVRLGDELIGVVNIETTRPNAYDESDQRIIETVASQIAVAIQNSRLYEQARNEIAERKRIAEDLRQSEDRYRDLVENSHDLICTHDLKGNLLSVNRASAAVTGYSVNTLLNMNLGDILTEETLRTVPIYLKRIQKYGRARGLMQVRTASGDIRIWEYDNTLRSEGVATPVVRGIAHDITDRWRAEEKLKQREERFRSMIENASDVITIIDDTATIHYESPAIERMLGYHPDELIGRLVFELIHPDDLNHVAEAILGAFPTPGVNATAQFRFLHKDGSWRYLEAVGKSVVDENGRLIGIINSRDITERRLAEETIRKYASDLEKRVEERTIELTHANRAKDEFLATMSHELRTPLNSILGLSETLLEQRRGRLNDKQHQYANLIHSSGQHLLGLINDILEVSKIEAGKLELQPEPVYLRQICESSLGFVKDLAIRKNISLEYDNEHMDIHLTADPRRLKQILVNLLNNAVKFTPERGKVTLAVHPHSDGDRIKITVSDTGIGIAQEHLTKLFTPFTQLDSSLSRQYEGTGLGLVLVKKLTELHGGQVTVQSEPGKGSSFQIDLPWQSPQPQRSAGTVGGDGVGDSPSHGHTNSPGYRILIAEDNPSNVLTLQDYLVDRGHTVTVAGNGEEAVRLATEVMPDLVLMDIQMPVMDGIEAIRRLRTDMRFTSTPIIALTALAMPGDRERCLQAGANEYMSKPVRLKELTAVIHTMMEGSLIPPAAH